MKNLGSLQKSKQKIKSQKFGFFVEAKGFWKSQQKNKKYFWFFLFFQFVDINWNIIENVETIQKKNYYMNQIKHM
jgi:hypothetical protein